MTKKKVYTAIEVTKYLIYLASRNFVGDDRECEGLLRKNAKLARGSNEYFIRCANAS